MKTNNKKVIENINNYIIDCCDPALIEIIPESATLEEKKKIILNKFIYEKLKNYNYSIYETLKRFYNNSIYEAFKDWAQGLPCGALFCYYYNVNAVDLVGGWLEQTESEKAKYTESQAEETATRLLFRELTKKTNIFDLILEG